ncbi:S1C family serine protease [Eubacterium xylanophilum]|uniref:S1C family serine protease n=1 Tax=Eubacterium xylanophilum TaxID=39497 RepID=UPI0004AF68BC|nr:trypsin-like peptidase domain-containing protein [Eubacterium xylanophilum]
MSRVKRIIAGACVMGLVGGLSFQAGSMYNNKANNVMTSSLTKEATPSAVKMSSSSALQGSNDVSSVAEAVLPSIVAIDVTVVQETSDFFGRRYKQEGQGSGSGIIFKEDDNYIYIVTNNHVVSDANKVSITYNDKSKSDATVVGTDSNVDIAVVKVAKKDLTEQTLKNISVAEFADSKDVKVGSQAIAIGNALGYGTSVTGGYVSAKDRVIATQSESGKESESVKLIQTDAAINPGNSGGALVSLDGKVIGINSSKFASEEVEGMGFAIPSSTAVEVINRILSNGDSGNNNNQSGNSSDNRQPDNSPYENGDDNSRIFSWTRS